RHRRSRRALPHVPRARSRRERPPHAPRRRRLMTKQAVQRLLNRRWFEVALGGLIVISVALTVTEIATPSTRLWAVYTVHGITALFAVELAVRWYVASSARRFLRDFWIDGLSVVPLVAIGGSPTPPTWLGALALLRIVRLFRLLKI